MFSTAVSLHDISIHIFSLSIWNLTFCRNTCHAVLEPTSLTSLKKNHLRSWDTEKDKVKGLLCAESLLRSLHHPGLLWGWSFERARVESKPPPLHPTASAKDAGGTSASYQMQTLQFCEMELLNVQSFRRTVWDRKCIKSSVTATNPCVHAHTGNKIYLKC